MSNILIFPNKTGSVKTYKNLCIHNERLITGEAKYFIYYEGILAAELDNAIAVHEYLHNREKSEFEFVPVIGLEDSEAVALTDDGRYYYIVRS